MTKFPKLRTLTDDEKSKKIFVSTPCPHDFFDPYWPPELCPTCEHAKINSIFLDRVHINFHGETQGTGRGEAEDRKSFA